MRSKQNNFRWGDSNTRYFHSIATARKKQNTIAKLQIRGVDCFDQHVIKEELRSFYINLFSQGDEVNSNMENLHFPKIAEADRLWLERDFSENRVWDVVRKMGCNKSPGPDGFTAEFFKNYWSMVKEDFMNLVKDFNRYSSIDSRFIFSFITLIPKKEDSCTHRDYRPLSLIGMVYKILSKLLANRLKKVMLVLISDFQGAFIHGKQIFDGVLIANECVDSRLKARKPRILCKNDMEKAFDNVNWQALLTILQKHEFGVKWIKWCVTYTHISLFVNGGSTEKFKPSKGLRQGDSLSPYLFLLVVKILFKLINDAVERGQLSGFQVVNHGTIISHLQFADDTLIFLDPSVEEVRHPFIILTVFETITGLKLNLDKSTMISVGADGIIDALARELGCKTENYRLLTLGCRLVHIGAAYQFGNMF